MPLRLVRKPLGRIYTGVGSRRTPAPVLDYMRKVAGLLAEKGWMLRSGGAEGADTAFELGARDGGGPREIYIPWEGFESLRPDYSAAPYLHVLDLRDDRGAIEIAKSLLPHWFTIRTPSQKCHARNVLQVLGKDLDEPSSFVICWTKDGKASGGTATAIKLAKEQRIPLLNLGALLGQSLPAISPKALVRLMDGIVKGTVSLT